MKYQANYGLYEGDFNMNAFEAILSKIISTAILVALVYVVYKGLKILYKRSHSNLVRKGHL